MSAPTVQPLFAKTILARTITAYYIRPQPFGLPDEDQFDPRLLFTNNEKGVWFDPSDFSTLFQDAAGTTPVTAVGQPVGLMLDKSAGLILGSDQRQSIITGVAGTATAATYNTSTGAGTATRVDASNQSFVKLTGLTATSTYVASIQNTGSTQISVRRSNQLGAIVYTIPVSASASVYFSGDTVLVLTTDTGTSGFVVNSIKEIKGNHATQATAASRPLLQQDSNGRYYLAFDGTDDGLATAAIDFSSSSDIEVFSGLRNNIDSHQKLVMIGTYATQSGSFEVAIGEVNSGSLGVAKSNGTTNYVLEAGTKSAPRQAVSYLKINAASSSVGAAGVIRVNGAQVGVTAGGSGGGYSFANAVMYIGSSNAGTIRFNGRLYGLIVRGAATNTQLITATERWMNTKTMAY